MNTTIAGAIVDSVVKLLNHSTDLVRKKAILALQRIVTVFLFRNKSREGKWQTIRIK